MGAPAITSLRCTPPWILVGSTARRRSARASRVGANTRSPKGRVRSGGSPAAPPRRRLSTLERTGSSCLERMAVSRKRSVRPTPKATARLSTFCSMAALHLDGENTLDEHDADELQDGRPRQHHLARQSGEEDANVVPTGR